ncbi:putative HlyD-family transporter [Flavobacteriales bacterium ALC-1]|nr:putative HlyD-family transporter [Flavobacteriales bacterium ALC-1]
MPDNLDIELRSEEVQDVLEAVPHWMIRYGNMFVLGLIVMLLFISWFIKYPDIVTSEAIITTDIPPQKEYTKVTGKLDTILVSDNEVVSKDKPLAIVENTAKFADVYYLKSILDTIKVNNKVFYFPIESLPILFLGDIESDYALFENNYLQYQLNKELKPFSNEAIANQISKSELYSRLRTLQSQKSSNKSELELQKIEFERYKKLFNKGVISKHDYESRQVTYLQAQRNYANIDASISQIREAISNANKTSRGTEINRTKEEINLLKKVIQSFNQLKHAIKNWEIQYALTSKIDGQVIFLNLWTKNQTVNKGDLIFTIIPKENSTFIAKLKTPAQNSGKLKIGQTVNIKLENFPDTEFGTLKGNIKSISLFPDENGFYFTTVTLPSKLITSYKKEIDFKYEMRGSAEIITEDLRLIERFFYQLKNILDN